MNIKSHITAPKRLLLGLTAAALVGMASIYSVATAQQVEANEPSKATLIVDKQAERHIEIEDEDSVYIEENGQYFIEKDGKRRAMTVQERDEFEQKFDASSIALKGFQDGSTELKIDGLEGLKGLKGLKGLAALSSLSSLAGLAELKGLAELEGLSELKDLAELRDLEELEGLAELADLADLAELIDLADIDIRVVEAGVESSMLEKVELEQVLGWLENAGEKGNIGDKQLKKNQRELKALQKQLAKDEERLNKTREKAREAARKARASVHRDAV